MTPDRFAEQFLLPLVRGGTLHVGAPLGRVGLEKLRAASLDGALAADIALARQAVAAELLFDPIPPPLDLEALRLAVAAHDLLFLAHPRAAAVGVRGRLGDIAEFASKLAKLPPTLDADTLVARHTLLHLLPALGRTDVRVSFWVGKREFHGEEPPLGPTCAACARSAGGWAASPKPPRTPSAPRSSPPSSPAARSPISSRRRASSPASTWPATPACSPAPSWLASSPGRGSTRASTTSAARSPPPPWPPSTPPPPA
jgi:hypothetical protein